MQIHDIQETDLFKELSDQEQEVVAGGVTWDLPTLQAFWNYTFGLIGQYGGFYNNFDYYGFFGNLQQNGWLDSTSPSGSNSTIPGSAGWRG